MSDIGNEVVFHSFDVSTMEGKMALLNAMGEATFKAEVMKTNVMFIQDVVIHNVTVNGEPIERVVLVTPEGDTIGFVSEGMRQSINRVISVVGKPPWIPALPMKVKEVSTRSGFKTYNLELVTSSKGQK